jgi:hypothetical protein
MQIDDRSLHAAPINRTKLKRAAMDSKAVRANQRIQPARRGLNRRTQAFVSEINAAVRFGRLEQPFTAEAVRQACPGYAEGAYRTFFRKHCVGNLGGMAELFLRRGSNRFAITESRLSTEQRLSHDPAS